LLLVFGTLNMFQNGLPVKLLDRHGCTYEVPNTDVPSPVQQTSHNPNPSAITVLNQVLSSQSYITKTILFLAAAEKSLFRITCNLLRANLATGRTLRYSPTRDFYLFRNEVLIPGEGGVNA
jgi:hypothetical protein